jgi:hypothetical protein
MRTLENNMPFLCELGWHRPRDLVRWNSGYYFTRCARCGCDLVRTAYGRWHEPRGYRVVWQAEPPANAVSAALVRERNGDPPSGTEELPIQEVLRHLQNGDSPAEAPAVQPSAPGRVPSRIPDFMEATSGIGAWESAERSYLLRIPSDEISRMRATSERQGAQSRVDFADRLKQSLAGLFRGQSSDGSTDAGDGEPERVTRVRLAFYAGIAIVAALLLLVVWQASGNPDAASNGTAAENRQRIADPGQNAFVTASMLNCRTAPAIQAETVETLARGDGVQLLSRDGEWVSLVTPSGQCWALARYFSVDQPQ